MVDKDPLTTKIHYNCYSVLKIGTKSNDNIRTWVDLSASLINLCGIGTDMWILHLNIDILYQIHFTQALLFDQTGKILSLKLINKNSKLLILYSWGVWKTFKVKLRFCNISTQSIQAIVKKYAMFWLTDQGFDSYSINSLKISVLKKIKLNVKNFEKKGLQMRCRFFSPVSIYDICNHLGFWAEKPASFPHWYELKILLQKSSDNW